MSDKYRVSGMSCAACSARVEGAVSALDGVTSCAVNLLTGEMRVEGEAAPEVIVSAVRQAGYDATLMGDEPSLGTAEQDGLDDGSRPLISRLIRSLGLLAVLMYFSMGNMLGAPMPPPLDAMPIAIAVIQLVLAAGVMIINRKFFINGIKGVIHLAPNMDTLVSLGSAASFIYSCVILGMMIAAEASGAHSAHYLHELYFESAAMILALITVGKLLEAKAKGRTTDALRSLISLAPKRATVMRGELTVEVDISELRVGDVFVVRAGDSIPTDGVVISGSGTVDESMLSGESLPVDKSEGARVYGATINRSGYMLCRATVVGEDTALAGIIRMVKDASSTKAPIAKLADRVSGIFVPVVLGISLLTVIGWLIAGEGIGYAVMRAVSVLVISCPCALGLATPVAIMVGTGVGAKRGILYKTAAALEECGRVRTVVLDKTGTITKGEMAVTDVVSLDERLLSVVLSLEEMSEHPLGAAAAAYAKDRGASPLSASDFKTLPGRGVYARVGGEDAYGVSFDYAKTLTNIDISLENEYKRLASFGKTPIVFILGGRCLGMLAVADSLKVGAREGIAELRDMGIRVIMLTGDNELSARAVAEAVGIDEVIAGVLPEGKESVIRSLLPSGKVAMVGDGINDAPSLTRADVGIAVGCGTDIAIESADVVLMGEGIGEVASALALGRASLMNIRENLGWAFVYNAVGIPMAAGLFGLALDPMFGALAMSLSSFSVVMNALRLNLWRPRSEKKRRKGASGVAEGVSEPESGAAAVGCAPVSEGCDCDNIKENTEETEREKMVKVIKVEGMMCPHCEARVKKTLEAFDEVILAVPSHAEGTVTLTLTGDVDMKPLADALEAQGYPLA